MFKNLRLKSKLLFFFIGIGLIPMIVISVVTYQMGKRNIQQEIFAKNQLYLTSVSDQLNDFMENKLNEVQIIATSRDVWESMNTLRQWGLRNNAWVNRRDTALAPLAERLVNEYGYSFVLVLDWTGGVVYSTVESMIGNNMSSEQFYQDVRSGLSSWSDMHFSEIVNDNVMIVSHLIRAAGTTGDIVGVLSLGISADAIQNRVLASVEELGGYIDAYLFDAEGILLTSPKAWSDQEGIVLATTIESDAVSLLQKRLADYESSGYSAEDILGFVGQDFWDDFSNQRVLGSLEVIQIGNTLAGLVVEINEDEAFSAITGTFGLRNILFIIVGLVAIVGVLVFLRFATKITNAIEVLLVAIQAAEQGDLTKVTSITSNDEIGKMEQFFNNMLVNLRRLIQDVSQAVDTVYESAQEMSSSAQQTSASVEEVASSTNAFTSSVDSVKINSQEIAELAVQTKEVSLSGVQQAETTATAMTEISDTVKDLAEGINRLGIQSDQIEGIVNIITDIADKTNLLALNAAIEAARAGEHGRGFAVVSEEVKKLADQSREAAGEITQLVTEIRNSTRKAVSQANDGAKKVEEGMAVVTESGKMFEQISNAVEKLTAGITEVATASEQLAAGAQEISATTEEQSASVEQIASAAERVAQIATSLKEMMDQFTV